MRQHELCNDTNCESCRMPARRSNKPTAQVKIVPRGVMHYAPGAQEVHDGPTETCRICPPVALADLRRSIVDTQLAMIAATTLMNEVREQEEWLGAGIPAVPREAVASMDRALSALSWRIEMLRKQCGAYTRGV